MKPVRVWPRTQRGDGDAGGASFGPQRQAERQHECLARSIHGLVWRGLKRDRRCDVENATAFSRNHSRQERVGKRDHGIDVDGNLVGLALRVGVGKWTVAAEPGVVDQHLDRPIADAIEQRRYTRPRREIGRDRFDLDPRSRAADFLRHLAQAVLVAAAEQQRHPTIGEPGGYAAAQA
jgi:hypothetical protein